MKLLFKVTYDDGRVVESAVKPKDVVAFERQYGQTMAAFSEPGKVQLEWLYYLAWSPLHRSKQEPRAFDEFLDSVEEIDEVEEPEPVPFPPAPSAAPSPA
jgi:hypothetical protein